MNVLKLRGKIAENNLNVKNLAERMGIDRSTLHRKLEDVEKFTVGEALRLKEILNLTEEEAAYIFLS